MLTGDVDWKTLRSHCSFEEFPIVFTDTLLQICLICCPRKKISNGRPKALNALRRKKKRVLARYNALLSKSHSNPEHVAALQSKLALICYEIKDEINKSLDRKEALALSRIKANPKYFFSYAKSLSKVKSSIIMLVTSDDSITNNPSKMADILQNQFTSVFSDPNAPNVKAPDFDVPSIKEQSNELGFYMTDEQAIAAIDKISSNAASGPDGVPVTLLKTCSRELCQPIKLIWAESFAKKEIPSFYKQTCISPIYKSGNRAEAINYRQTVYTCLRNCDNIASQLRQKTLPVVYDEGVYHLVTQIYLQQPELFLRIFPMLGGFHFTKTALHCAGKFLKGSGVEDIFTECRIFGPKTVDSVMNGKHYYRSLEGLTILSESMTRMKMKAFWK